jgi:hypothetical protein
VTWENTYKITSKKYSDKPVGVAEKNRNPVTNK